MTTLSAINVKVEVDEPGIKRIVSLVLYSYHLSQ